MVDLVAPGAACAALQAEELSLQAIIVEQRDGAAVQQWQELLVYLGLGELTRIVLDPVASELLGRPFSGVPVALDRAYLVGP